MKATNLTSEKLDRVGLVHGFTTRLLGDVLGSLVPWEKATGFSQASLVRLNQVHGTEVLVVDRPIDELPRGAALSYDASVTNRTDLILSVRTADCVPIILYAPDAPAVGAVHAGWRGTQAGTVTAAIDAMQGAFHCRPREMMAVIGPCIHACCYQVDGELYKQFQERFGSEAVTVLGDSTYVDLVAVNRLWMIECGVLAENIDVLDYCTMCREEMFFSYRREAGRAGRQLAYVKL